MGPFVQGDGFYVVGTPPAQLTGRATGVASRQELLDEAAGWHRDAYNHHGLWRKNPGYAADLEDGGQPFTPPLAAHMLFYLQDMEGPGGPLLAVPGSHRNAFGDYPVGDEEEEKVVAVDAKAGDVVFFHCDMLHSGSVNRTDDAWRYMVTSFVVRAGLPHRDDFAGSPLVRALVTEAEARGDRRVLRFFAADTADGGPLSREEKQWRAAIDTERLLLRSTL
jgi:ectoine hydroxylase-related dioxygenase (phytanoyl-CoA dioxygenase family)